MLINIDADDITPPAPVARESAQARFERDRTAYRERARQIWAAFTFVVVVVLAIAFCVGAIISGDIRIAGIIAGIATIVAIAALVRYIPQDVVSWHHGAEAERAVGTKLDALERLGFVTLYDRRVPGLGGNIDAITVGPPGVFVVETKHRGRGVEVIQGRFEVGGYEQGEVVRQVTDQALRVQIAVAQVMNRHRLTVVPVICIGNFAASLAESAPAGSWCWT